MAALRETDEFKRGRSGERLVASIVQSRGWFVISSYDYSGEDDNKPPRMQGASAAMAIPDLDLARSGQRRWAEVKTKKSATLHRKTARWEHGIGLRLFNDYRRVEEETGTEVWLFVFEENTKIVLCATLNHLDKHKRIYDPGDLRGDGAQSSSSSHQSSASPSPGSVPSSPFSASFSSPMARHACLSVSILAASTMPSSSLSSPLVPLPYRL